LYRLHEKGENFDITYHLDLISTMISYLGRWIQRKDSMPPFAATSMDPANNQNALPETHHEFKQNTLASHQVFDSTPFLMNYPAASCEVSKA
jgi:hypothetical protein